jgi:beta-phosphoglucomutase-like phosphatase (HAD superfamily)
MLLDTMQALGARPERTWMIGDSSADVVAGQAAGVRVGLLFADNRCELCPLRSAAVESSEELPEKTRSGGDGPKVTPTCHASKLPALVRAILDIDLGTI